MSDWRVVLLWSLAISLLGACASATDPRPAPRAAASEAAEVADTDADAPEQDANAAIAAGVPVTDIYLLPLPPLLRGESPMAAKAVTLRDGYDNQPAFTPGGRAILYASIRDGAQADVYRYTIETGATRRLTATPQSEYSPTPRPGGGFSCVQVALDGTQRLYLYGDDGQPRRAIRGDLTGVGYHAWLDAQRVALFMVGEPLRLILADVGGTGSREVTVQPGRALHALAGGKLAYVSKRTEPWTVQVFDPATGSHTPRAPLFDGVEDLAWLRDGTALTANGRSLFALGPDARQWRELASLARVVPGDITRLAVDPGQRWLAVVSSRTPADR